MNSWYHNIGWYCSESVLNIEKTFKIKLCTKTNHLEYKQRHPLSQKLFQVFLFMLCGSADTSDRAQCLMHCFGQDVVYVVFHGDIELPHPCSPKKQNIKFSITLLSDNWECRIDKHSQQTLSWRILSLNYVHCLSPILSCWAVATDEQASCCVFYVHSIFLS